jgi:valyl-tRNA synthetase
VIPGAVIYIPFADLVDVEKEIARLEKEAARLDKEIKRANGMLNNQKFVSKAPADKVAAEKEKLEKYTAMAAQVAERLSQLKK